ncbi:MAG: ATP-binding protein, partial [Cyanobacteria bacterium REEB65]|nr:ATP-binding protein [Cyanobacteria bacterium REEB65]
NDCETVLTLGPDIGRRSTFIEITAFRIAQEALSNVGRHAKASKVEIALEERGERLCLTIRDNGQGFQPAELASRPSRQRAGMLAIGEMAALAGGTVATSSAPGKGTLVEVNLPGSGEPTAGTWVARPPGQ